MLVMPWFHVQLLHAILCAIIVQLLQGAKIITQLFYVYMWFYVQLLHATRCNNSGIRTLCFMH